MKFLNFYIILFVVLLWLSSCANVASLSGGPRDVKPPYPDSLKSTPNFQTRFKPSKIQLHFDEWIALKNPGQILISPPTSKKPEIKQRGKKITFEFDKSDTLKENTTYNVNFGNSITDFTEGNALKNYSFIFSTGDKIDSLIFQGQVINSNDKKPEKDILVMLYDRYEDSIVAKSKPFYFAYTNDKGSFRITNIKEGKYKVFALKDANSNYLFDNVNENIAFSDTLVQITVDTQKSDIVLNLFQPDMPILIKDKSISGYGKINLSYPRKPDSIRILNSSVKILRQETIKDSVIIWYEVQENIDSIQLVVKSEVKTDTLNLKPRKKFEKPLSLSNKSGKGILNTHPDKAIFLEFNQPVFPADSSLIQISDTNNVKCAYIIEKDPNNDRIIRIKGSWNEEKKYNLIALPGSFRGIHNQVSDSIIINFRTNKRNNFGNIICSFDSLDINMHYIVLLKQKESIIEERIIKGKNKAELSFPGLEPGVYSLDVILDENKNGRWNGGDYFKKKQSEKVLKFEINELKKNWDQKEKFSLKLK